MSQPNTVYIRIRCFNCFDTQLGYYEVTEGVALDELPLARDFLCNECREKERKEKEILI